MPSHGLYAHTTHRILSTIFSTLLNNKKFKSELLIPM